MTISVALAIHNEEKNIIPCLEAVYDWVDEIVIVDGASTVNTKKYISDFRKEHYKKTDSNRFQLISTNNPPMFHINKQKAIDACTEDWILQLDADEIVSPELKDEILQKINSNSEILNPKQIPSNKQILNSKLKKKILNTKYSILNTENDAVAYWIPRLNYFLGKPLRKGGQYPDYTIRLYRNGVARFPCKDVHENVEVRSTEIPREIEGSESSQNSKLHVNNIKSLNTKYSILNTEVGFLKSPLLHFPYPTFSEYLNKWNRYCVLEAKNLKEKGIKPSLYNALKYYIFYPKLWFLKTYFRHKGFMDGVPGFVFCLCSAMRYWKIYYDLRRGS